VQAFSVHEINKYWLPWQRPNPENLAKIGPVDLEIIGQTEIVKNE